MKTIRLESKIINDKYTEYVCEMFDIQNTDTTIVEIPMNFEDCKTFDWNIGVIYGGSGTGKTTLLRHFGSISTINFDENKSLISNFDFLEPKEATLLLTSMGLGSVPTWLRPFKALSNGEQYRAELAYKVGKAKDNDVILIDEFTSVVDRDVAKSMSNALGKYIKKHNKRIILASCHFDIMEWLMPDWTYSPLKGRVERHEYRRQDRPKVKLSIFRCRYEAWNIFKQHHYLTADLNKTAETFILEMNGQFIGFFGILPFPGVGDAKTRRLSRMVILPDFQGLGIGTTVFNYLCSLYKKEGHQMYVRTVSPALGKFMENNSNWMPTSSNGKIPGEDSSGRKLLKRPGYSYKYIGEESNDSTDIIKMNRQAWKDVAQNQITLF
jgi:ABC-type lipoprotein export system ATPase subunit/GNAT superfamily N-acetyltransferase